MFTPSLFICHPLLRQSVAESKHNTPYIRQLGNLKSNNHLHNCYVVIFIYASDLSIWNSYVGLFSVYHLHISYRIPHTLVNKNNCFLS